MKLVVMEKRRIRILFTSGMRDIIDEKDEKGEPLGPSPRFSQILPFLDPNTEIVERGTPDASVGHVEQFYEDALVAPFFVRNAVQAEKEGFDAVIQGCHSDPGVDAAREACTIPIISVLECACHVAAMLGRKFSIIIISRYPEGSPHLYNLVDQCGLSSKLASIRGIDLPPTAFNEEKMTAPDLERIKKTVLSAAKKAINEDAAQVIVAYGHQKVLDYLQSNLDVPVLQGAQIAPFITEMFVKLRLSQSRRTYPRPRRLRAYGAPAEDLPPIRRKAAERPIVQANTRARSG